MSNTNFNILIICEGRKTEPLFFNLINDEIIAGTYNLGNIRITISPEPLSNEEDLEDSSPHKRSRIKKKTKKVAFEPEEISEPHPLKWVLQGQKALEEGIFNEVWIVFDRDNHPARQEAFEAANKEINGTTVNIAFSSISFEYYLLMHFERIYYSFSTSECSVRKKPGAKRKIIKCNDSNNHPNDCLGRRCVGGYARGKGYWDSSKDESMFPMVKDLLEIGFENSAWLRYQSQLREPSKPIYDRNPYVTADHLIKRLTNNDLTWEWIPLNEEYEFDNIQLLVTNEKKLHLVNIGSSTIILPAGFLCFINPSNNTKQQTKDRVELIPRSSEDSANEVEIDLITSITNPDGWFILTINDNRIMFDFQGGKECLYRIAEELTSLSHKELLSLIRVCLLSINC